MSGSILNKLLIIFSDFTATFLQALGLYKSIRKGDDIRLVFYHGIGERDSATMKYLNDEIPVSVFKRHIEYLQDKYEIMSLKDAVDLAISGNLPREKPVCTISFDDGLHSVYRDAYPLLKERGIPFDVFLNTSVVGNHNLLWLHALNYLLTINKPEKVAQTINGLIADGMSEAPLDAQGIEYWCRNNFEYLHKSNLIGQLFDHFDLNMEEVAENHRTYLTWDQVEEMRANGAGFYSHTHSHFPLSVFSNEDDVKNELMMAYNEMENQQHRNTFISFPFGMEVDYGKNSIQLALSVGHEFIVEVGNGLNSPDRIINNKVLSRVNLGNTGQSCAKLYAAIEIRPVVKSILKSLLTKNRNSLT